LELIWSLVLGPWNFFPHASALPLLARSFFGHRDFEHVGCG
jgi:hypothetical protein